VPVRVCVIGGGLAGAMLTWRLAGQTRWELDLMTGDTGIPDATAASGGAVRAYERHPEQRRLATLSLMELRSSRTLRRWAQFRPLESAYLLGTPADGGDGLDTELAEIEALLPGSARRGTAADLAALGWAGVPADAVAVLERVAGYTAPGALRAAALAARAVRRRVRVLTRRAESVAATPHGSVAVTAAGRQREYETVVIATGAWTPALLQASGLPAGGYRTKSIQYGVHATEGWRPTQFVDETTGLYGRPAPDGGLLLGLPTERWDVDPARPPHLAELSGTAARLAQARFPKLRLGPVRSTATAADCYADQPVLCLRPVLDTVHQLLTFTGGAGGSVKTVLAASQLAADQLAGAHRRIGAAADTPRSPSTPIGSHLLGRLRERSQR